MAEKVTIGKIVKNVGTGIFNRTLGRLLGAVFPRTAEL